MNKKLWHKAVAFHGHECPGLAIGVKVCEAVIKILGVSSAIDEELVCITENDACGVDAIQALLSCTVGKGNLIFQNTGKQAFTFIKRESGTAIRFYLKLKNPGMERTQYQDYLLNAPLDEVFDWQEIQIALPKPAQIFSSIACEQCGEFTSEHKIRLQAGKKVCLACFRQYTRGW